MGSLHAKDPKVLVLIIASDNTEAYLELQKVWRSYMHSDPEHVEAYFIRGNPNLSTPYEIKGDDLFVKTEESYTPGIFNKTVLSMEVFLPKMKEYDYVIRTNLSSFYVLPRLLNFLKSQPKEKYYSGIQMHLPPQWNPQFGLVNFVSGAGIILSSDLVEMLVREKEEVFKLNTIMPDDVLIGWFFQNKAIYSKHAGRTDFQTKEEFVAAKGNIPNDSFHFRAKSNYNFRSSEEIFADEIFIDRELVKMFYPESKK